MAISIDQSLEERVAALFASEPEALLDPYLLFRDLREAAPVHEFGPRVLVTRHQDVKAIIRDERRFSNSARAQGSHARYLRSRVADEYKPLFDEIVAFERLYVSRSNGEDHQRLRRIAHRAFTPRRIAALGEAAQRYLDGMLEPMAQEECSDFTALAYRLPLMIIGDLLGVPHADHNLIHGWTDALARNHYNTEPEPLLEANAAMKSLAAYVEEMIEDHRRAPEVPDLVETLVGAEEGERLTAQELTAMFAVLLFGGHETTTNLIAIGLLSLLRNRAQWEALCDDPALAPAAVEELLRWVTPVQFGQRLPVVDVEIAGHEIPAGQAVFTMTAGVNRDPDVFAGPETLDITRTDSGNHLSLGFGPHFCLGSSLARLEGTIVFATLAERFPEIELASDSFRFEGSSLLRRLTSLPVHMGPAQSR